MQTYILRRLAFAVPVLVLTSVIVFGLLHLVPGDVIIARLADQGTVKPADVQQMKHQYGLDKSLPEQYAIWVSRILRADLGHSIYTGRSINASVRDAFPVTIELTLLAMLFGTVIGVPIGVVSATMRGTGFDYAGRVIAILGLSAPNFWVASMAITYMAIWFGWIPPLSYRSFAKDPLANVEQLLLPALVIGYGLGASVMRMTRSALLEVLREDYVRTARAKGIGPAAVVVRHALKNACLPVVTIMGGQLAVLLGGAIIIETIFALPGMGRLAIEGLTFRDYPLVQALVMVFTIIVIFTNLLVDLSYAWLDPRIRFA
jgi:peptide/nickel transport system permease protein